MSNWEYARRVPTSWGRGVESIPRKLELQSSARGYEFFQTPLSGLQPLRLKKQSLEKQQIQGTVTPSRLQPDKNSYELDAVFEVSNSSQNFGLNLCVGNSNKVVIGYDAATSNIYLDRRNSGEVSFSPAFRNIVTAPSEPVGGYMEFHIYVDQSTVEVFVNDGRAVMSSLIFPDARDRGIQIFSSSGSTKMLSLTLWPLRSIWQ
jgi:sucrose-6-phosphate hydrolase SacC (GH32 family)